MPLLHIYLPKNCAGNHKDLSLSQDYHDTVITLCGVTWKRMGSLLRLTIYIYIYKVGTYET